MERKRSTDGKFLPHHSEADSDILSFRLPSFMQVCRLIFQVLLMLPWLLFAWRVVVYFNLITWIARLLDFTRPAVAAATGANGEEGKGTAYWG